MVVANATCRYSGKRKPVDLFAVCADQKELASPQRELFFVGFVKLMQQSDRFGVRNKMLDLRSGCAVQDRKIRDLERAFRPCRNSFETTTKAKIEKHDTHVAP